MGQTAVTIQMDSDLKQEIESSPITKEELLAKGKDAFEQLRLQAENNGLSSMTLDDINAEIRESRN